MLHRVNAAEFQSSISIKFAAHILLALAGTNSTALLLPNAAVKLLIQLANPLLSSAEEAREEQWGMRESEMQMKLKRLWPRNTKLR